MEAFMSSCESSLQDLDTDFIELDFGCKTSSGISNMEIEVGKTGNLLAGQAAAVYEITRWHWHAIQPF